MARKPFRIDKAPPAPLSVEKTAEKYGVSKTALDDIKGFVTLLVSGPKGQREIEFRVLRNGRWVGRTGAATTRRKSRVGTVNRRSRANRSRSSKTANRKK